MLATAGHNGAPQALLSARGFDATVIAGLVNHGLATVAAEKVRAGGKMNRGRQGADYEAGAAGAWRLI